VLRKPVLQTTTGPKWQGRLIRVSSFMVGGLLIATFFFCLTPIYTQLFGSSKTFFEQPSPTIKPKGQTTLLVPSATHLDFGQVAAGTRSKKTLSLRNSSESAIKVTAIRTSCDCLQVRLDYRTIQPGEEVAVTVFLDFSDDPGFTGRLLLDAIGLMEGGRDKAFTFQVAVEVR
jgi:hypothetical protein